VHNDNIGGFTKAREIKCPACGRTSSAELWRDVDVPCEVCDDHAGTECPVCKYSFDCVWDLERFEQ
jgi:C4-type Zn-finger protein